MSARISIFVALLAVCSLGYPASAQQRPTSPERPTPCDLIAQPATRITSDSLPGMGRVSFIGGGVFLKCPARGITLRGDSAEQYPDRDVMVGHAIYDEPRFHVTADFLNYFPTDERVVAAGNVHATLPSGSKLDGPQAEYKRAVPRIRKIPEMNAIARPTITIVEKDSLGRPQPPTTVVANTVHMVGDSASLIYGGGQVVITRPDIGATADSAFIDEGREFMQLMRNPRIKGKKERSFTLTGDVIDMFSRNRKLERVLARPNAVAVSDSMTLTADTIDLRVKNDLLDHAYAWGAKSRARAVSPSQNLLADSLDVFMPGQHVQLVRALRKALAEGKPDSVRFKVEAPDSLDWLQGDTIIAHFDTAATKDTSKSPAIRELVSSGHAASLYHMAPSDTAERRAAINYVTARVITVNFDKQRVATVTTVDSVAGVFVEPKADTTARTRRANGASAASAGAAAGKTQPPKSVIPLPGSPPPARPPIRP